MKTYYDLLGIAPTAEPEEVKRAFRKEIARYHPDKVQHLGPEFQEIAASRAAELTEAYRTLMDAELRRRYDGSLADGVPPPAAPRPAAPPAPPPAPTAAPTEAPRGPAAGAPSEPKIDRRFAREQATTSDFVRRAVLVKLKEAIAALGGVPMTGASFDGVFQIKGRKALFRKNDPTVRLAVKIVPQVDAGSVEDAWVPAIRLPAQGETICLMLLGSGMASARDLAGAVSEQRRKTRGGGPVVVPVDMRDWTALLPPETPPAVRSLLDYLREGK